MKRNVALVAFSAVTILLYGVSGAHAAITNVRVSAGDTVTMGWGTEWYGFNISGVGEVSGGDFTMTVTPTNNQPNPLSTYGTFFTFCADPTQDMNIGVPYYVKTVTSGANTQNELGFQLDDFGKWLYYQWASNTSIVPGEGNSSFTSTEAGAIQELIWSHMLNTNPATSGQYPTAWSLISANVTTPPAFNEADTTLPGNPPPSWLTAWSADYSAATAYLGPNTANYPWETAGIGIAELALNSSDPGDQQNQLIFTVAVSGGTFVPAGVPEPATFIIWSLLGGLCIAMGWRRRRAA